MESPRYHETPEVDQLHRTAIQLGAFGGLVTVAAYLVWAIIDSDLGRVVNAVGPVVLSAICLYMLHQRIHRAEFVLIAAGLSTIVSYRVASAAEPTTPAAIGVVMIGSITAFMTFTKSP